MGCDHDDGQARGPIIGRDGGRVRVAESEQGDY